MLKAIIFDWGDTLMRDFREFSGAMLYWPKVEEVPGTAGALQILRERYLCCVASNAGDSDSELMGQALNRVGLRAYFHHLFTSKELGAVKPEPAFFQMILAELSLEPSECVMVGNDYVKDVAAAKAVGIKTVWLAGETGVNGPEDAGQALQADEVIQGMDELVAAIERLGA